MNAFDQTAVSTDDGASSPLKDLSSTRAEGPELLPYSLEDFAAWLQAPSLTAKQEAILFLSAFLDEGARQKIELLQQAGILERLIPEFSWGAGLTQDERFHGDHTVQENHLLAMDYMDALLEPANHFPALLPSERTRFDMTILFPIPFVIREAYTRELWNAPGMNTIQWPRFCFLLRLASFFQDLGKNNFGDEGSGKNRGERVLIESDTKFRRVRFSGHEVRSKEIFEAHAERLNSLLGFNAISELEECLIAAWIERGGQGKRIARLRDVRDTPFSGVTPEAAENSALKACDYAYSQRLLNARIPLAIAVSGLLFMQKVDFTLSDPTIARRSREFDELPQATEYFRRELAVFHHVVKYLFAHIHHFTSLRVPDFTIPQFGGGDWEALGIPKSKIRWIRQQMDTLRAQGCQFTRREALIEICRFAEVTPNLEVIEELSKLSSFRSGSKRWEGLQCAKVMTIGDASIRYYNAEPLRQFDEQSTAEMIGEALEGNAYPTIDRWLAEKVSDERVQQLKVMQEIFARGAFANLIQLENYLESIHQTDPRDIRKSKSMMPMIDIKMIRDGAMRHISVPFGFQGIDEHTGAGVIHIQEGRQKRLERYFARPGEGERKMLARFMEDAIIHVVCTGTYEIPSHSFPDRYFIVGKIKDDSRDAKHAQYVSVLLRREPNTDRVLTALFHPTLKDLKYDLRTKIKNLREQADADGLALDPAIEAAKEVFLQSLS